MSGHRPASISSASSSENLKTSNVTSASLPVARSRSMGRAGRRRPSSTRCSASGLFSTNAASTDWAAGLSSTRWRSSTTSTASSPSATSRSSVSTRRAPIGPSGLLTTAIARSATLGARVATAEIKAAQSWAGSRSDSSSVSHAEASPQPWTQSATRAVLPDPAGATKAVTGYDARSSNSSTSRVRRTKWSGALGIRNLDRKKAESKRPRWTTRGATRPVMLVTPIYGARRRAGCRLEVTLSRRIRSREPGARRARRPRGSGHSRPRPHPAGAAPRRTGRPRCSRRAARPRRRPG